MTASLIVSALCLLLVGTFVGVRAVRAARERHWLGGTIRGLVALLLLALAALAATLTVGLHGYRALSFEEVAATVRTEPVAPQRFRATIILPDQRLAMYELAGDAFYMDAHILKWHPWANLLGLHTVYELDRVAGRYNAVGDERTQPHTAYELALARAAGRCGVRLRDLRRGHPAGDIRGTRLHDRSAGAARAGPACSLRRRGRQGVEPRSQPEASRDP